MGTRIEGFAEINHKDGAPFGAFFLGVIITPPPYEKRFLGPVLRIILLSDEGQLIQDVVRPRYGTIVKRVGPLRVHIVPGKRGAAIATSYAFHDEPIDEDLFAFAQAEADIEWSGSAAELFGEDAVDLPPCKAGEAMPLALQVFPCAEYKPKAARSPIDPTKLLLTMREAKQLPPASPSDDTINE